MRCLLLLAVLAGVYLVHLEMPGVIDYDEASYAEVAREMHVRGDMVVPYYNGQPYYEKPPLLYWAMVAGYQLFGVNEVGARFFNVLGALGLILAVYLFTRGPLGKRTALLAALVLGSSFGFVIVVRMALTDMLLTLWLFLSLGCLHRGYERGLAGEGGTRWMLAAALFSGLAMLTKGLIGLVLPAGAAFFYLLSLRRLGLFFRPIWLLPGLLIAVLVGGAWYLLLGFTHEDGFEFMRTLFVEHHVGRFQKPMQGHSGPFFYYLPVLALGLLPWTGFLLPAMTRASRAGLPDEGRRYLRMLGIFAVMTLVFFSVAATKLPNYVTPLYPCLAIWVASVLGRTGASSGRAWRIAGAITIGVPFLGVVLFAAAPFVLERVSEAASVKMLREAPGLSEPFDMGAAPYVLAGFALALGLLLLWLWRQGRLRAVAWAVGGGSLALTVLVVMLLLPPIDAHFLEPLRTVARRAAETESEGPVAMVGLRYRASPLFYGPMTTRYVSGKSDEEVATLFTGPRAQQAITIEAYLERIRAHGRVEEVMRDTGYILLLCHP